MREIMLIDRSTDRSKETERERERERERKRERKRERERERPGFCSISSEREAHVCSTLL